MLHLSIYMTRKILLSLISCITINCYSQYYNNSSFYNINKLPKREIRAVWVTTLANLDWPKTLATSKYTIEKQKNELITMLDQFQKANINVVLLQTRVRAATIYPSKIEPWDGCITGTEGATPGYGYDPLQFAVEECHKRGIEIHAWIAAVPVGGSKSLGCKLMKGKGFDIKSFSSGSYVNPADPKLADYLADICAEITTNYDIDGINLDYIRYPDGWRKPSYREGDTPDDRRRNITKIVRAIHDKVKGIKRWVKISCSPIGKYSDLARYSSNNFNARDKVFQEAQEWLKMGLMDQIYPMQYFRGNNYYPFCADWIENSHGKDIITGLGTYFLDPNEGNWTLKDISRQMHVSRALGLGHAHFRSKFLLDNRENIYNFEKTFNSTVALTPVLLEDKVSNSTAPTNHTIFLTYSKEGETIVSWNGNSPFYNIYMSLTSPVDTSDPRQLVYAKFQGKSFKHKNAEGKKFYYAITSIDRFGKESLPLRLQDNQINLSTNHLLQNDGKSLLLPDYYKQWKVKFFTIESMYGDVVKRLYPASKRVEAVRIDMIPEGMYSIRAHIFNQKKSHRIGFFTIKR